MWCRRYIVSLNMMPTSSQGRTFFVVFAHFFRGSFGKSPKHHRSITEETPKKQRRNSLVGTEERAACLGFLPALAACFHKSRQALKNSFSGFSYFCRMIGFKLTSVKRYFLMQLVQKFSEREAEQLMRILLEDLFGIDQKSQILNPDMTLDELQHHDLEQAVDRLLKGEPVQYVTGVAEFCDMKLKVNPSVLIPRPETEELVQMICTTSLLCHSNVGLREGMESIGDGAKHRPMRIWDIGTGSGCIAIALAKHFTDAEVVAFDVSEAALETARRNANIIR